ncbi:hypothetical protein PRZ48_007627 [Zasmidium cellare]|uniref:Uncharacterized protein n=1 Tax=Zasmidium cellare TaxID=395010 RepID=A0ABR0ELZ3_ZASCE|nr:hypothetical protein PRZ48_007627 [Zasmidium cellare]
MSDSSSKPPDPPPPTRAATTGSTTTNLPPSAAARQRLPHRATSHQDASPSPRPDPLLRRRSSLLSFSSIEDATHAFTDDIINPRTGNRRHANGEDELTHWHSTPLAFAILPALGGLMFKNGSAFVTDVLLLGLAAIFMNWSIRLPWDWYYSAQALRRDVEPDYNAAERNDLEDDIAVETASSAGSSPKPSEDRKTETDTTEEPVQNVGKREEAAADLRRQELLALGATFLFPVLAAYLLHVIRAQLSRPSTGLVSDYNLCIFLLAAEIRPVRQVVRLVANRTLHLQRTVTGIDDPFSSAIEEKTTVNNLTSRLSELESKLAEHTVVPQTVNMAQKADVSDLSVEIRKRYEPRLEGLERAVRRYEKRSTTLAMMTEQRLQSLETRLQEALSLAAVAAQHSNRGVSGRLADTLTTIVTLPFKLLWELTIWPYRFLDDLYIKTKTILLGPMPQRSGKRRSARHDGSSRDDSRQREKVTQQRKVVR